MSKGEEGDKAQYIVVIAVRAKAWVERTDVHRKVRLYKPVGSSSAERHL